MNRPRVVFAAALVPVLFLPHVLNADPQQLTVRFAVGAVTTPAGRTGAHPSEVSFRNPALRGAMLAAGVQRLDRIFPNFRSEDRFSTNAAGERVVLEDLSVYYTAVLVDGMAPTQALATLRGAPAVREVSISQKGEFHDPNDPLFPLQWWLNDTADPGQVPCGADPAQDIDINAPEAWQIHTYAADDTSVRVGIIDSGVQSLHPDLWPRVEPGGGFAPNDYVGGACTGTQCECHTEGFELLPLWSSSEDTHGHGTAVAGIVAARGNNGTGVAGVAWGVTIKAYKIDTPCGVMHPAWAAAAVEAARTAQPPIQILNMSHGFGEDPAYRSAVWNTFYSGKLLVASMGNGRKHNTAEPDDPQFPAAFGTPVCAVGAVYDDGLPAYSSSRGSWIDLAAPGGAPSKIITTMWTGLTGGGPAYYDVCDTLQFGGTSAAAPVVSGVAALLLSRHPTLLGEDLQQIMVRTARDVVPVGPDIETGAGLVRADAAFAYLQWPRQVLHSQATAMALIDSQLVTGRQYKGLEPDLNPLSTYDAMRYRMRATITFPYTYNMAPDAWVRSSGTLGLANDAATFDQTREVRSGLVQSLTTTETILETFFYRVIRPSQASVLLPDGLQYSQAAVALTTVGTPDYGGGGCDPPPGGGPPDCENETESIGNRVAEGTTQWFDVSGRRIPMPQLKGVYFNRTFQGGKWTVRRIAIVK